MLFKAASYNANSIRSRIGLVLEWLSREKPDLLCLQEIKVTDKDFPLAEFQAAGYNAVFAGQKSYNGVAFISPHPIGEARLIAATVRGIPVVNTYVPQGRDPGSEFFFYKLKWIRSLRDYFNGHYNPAEPLLWTGDFNVAPEPEDVYDPKKLYGRIGYHPEEHKALQYVKEWGFIDVFRLHVPGGGHYTFWDYRVPRLLERNLGWRVDHIWATGPLARKSSRAWIDVEMRRREKPSDHTFIAAEFDI